jgi:thiamine biosynthesis lipoprotein
MTRRSRRDFLRGKATADAADPAPPQAPPAFTIQIGRRAMACEFEVVLNAGQYPDGTQAALDALGIVERLEDQLSVFRPQSEISRLNRLAADGPVGVEEGLFGLLELAVEVHRQSEGAYDITASPLWRVWGFARRQGAIPAEDELARALENVGSRWLDLDRDARTAQYLKRGLELNLGSIGKGYALDRAAAYLEAAGVHDFLFHGGASSVLARGSRFDGTSGGPSGEPAGWSVGVPHPLRPTLRLAELRLRNRALGTSSSAVQFFRHRGRRYGHILDPRTGWPAEQTLAVTVLAPTAAQADALSTAFFVLGREGVDRYCEAHPEIGALLVEPRSTAPGYEVHVLGAAQGDVQILCDE